MRAGNCLIYSEKPFSFPSLFLNFLSIISSVFSLSRAQHITVVCVEGRREIASLGYVLYLKMGGGQWVVSVTGA